MSTMKRLAIRAPKPAELEFDVTQEIDPALTELLRPGGEPTLTASDFDVDSMLDGAERAPRRR
jgi:hypothetical protein